MKPYLSIVVTGRNDNYGGDFTKRLQNFVNWNTDLLEKHQVSTEIIFINWNPIPENKSIKESIIWPENRKFVRYRLIDAPNEKHVSFVDETIRKTVPLFEFIAKNTGIRRAQGEFILSTNADILISEQIIIKISRKKLNKKSFYRANRLDFNFSKKLSESMVFKNATHVSLKGFMYSLPSTQNKRMVYIYYQGINFLKVKWELVKYKYYKWFDFLSISVNHDICTYWAHCLNSGDFMLMHKKHWFSLKSYPEYTQISTHTDALFTIFAYFTLKEVVFSPPIYHQNHERRFTWDKIQSDKLFKDTFREFIHIGKDIEKNKNIDNYLNQDNWGLKNFKLEETLF